MNQVQKLFTALTHETRFYIVRHGESTANFERRIQGHTDYPLSVNGKRQAESAGEWFRGKAIQKVFASPLERAYETATIISQTAGFPVPEVWDTLIELDTGKYSGLTVEEVQKRYPEENELFKSKSWAAVSDAETETSLYNRALTAWEKFITEANMIRGDILAVTHGGFIQWLVRTTFGSDTWFPLLTTGNCGLFLLHAIPVKTGMPCFLQWVHINYDITDVEEQVPPVF